MSTSSLSMSSVSILSLVRMLVLPSSCVWNALHSWILDLPKHFSVACYFGIWYRQVASTALIVSVNYTTILEIPGKLKTNVESLHLTCVVDVITQHILNKSML